MSYFKVENKLEAIKDHLNNQKKNKDRLQKLLASEEIDEQAVQSFI